MSRVRNWLHCAWCTKNQVPFITPQKKYEIVSHIRVNAGIRGVYIDCLDGHAEHIHCLLLLESDQKLSWVIQMIKGESSAWINKTKFVKEKFEWADEYYGVSVSWSHLEKVREYIKNQEEHHRHVSWEVECEEFVKESGLTR